MPVRRVSSGLLAVGAALAGTLLLAGPAAADEPTPAPTPVEVVEVDDSGMLDPGGNGQCFFVTPGPDESPGDATDEPVPDPTDEVTAEPGETVTPEPEATAEATGSTTDGATDTATDEPTGDPATDQPTPEPTDEPTDVPTDEPTGEPTDEPTGDPTPEPTGSYVCLAYTDGPLASGSGVTGGAGDATGVLPFGGAPVGRHLATGIGLLVAGTGTVLVARRRSAYQHPH